MSSRKTRLTVTVDGPLLKAGQRAVRSGRASSLSSWVNDALVEQAAKERRLVALAEAVASHEREHGKISDDEVNAQRRADRASAVIVRGRRPKRGAA